MAFEVVASSYQEQEKKRSPLGWVTVNGLAMGGIGLFASLVGIMQMIHGRWIVAEYLTLGWALMLVLALVAGHRTAAKIGSHQNQLGLFF